MQTWWFKRKTREKDIWQAETRWYYATKTLSQEAHQRILKSNRIETRVVFQKQNVPLPNSRLSSDKVLVRRVCRAKISALLKIVKGSSWLYQFSPIRDLSTILLQMTLTIQLQKVAALPANKAKNRIAVKLTLRNKRQATSTSATNFHAV